MRAFAVLFAAGVFSACSSTTFAEPRILVSPYLAVYQLRGDVALQSQPAPPPAPPQDNAPVPLSTFGQEHHREDVGVRADFGDGFAGVRVDYYKLDQDAADFDTLATDWGQLLAGDRVSMEAQMDELRFSWLEPVGTVRTNYRDRPLVLRFGLGGTLAYRSMDLRSATEDGARSQNVEIEGDVLYIAGRFRATWRDFSVDLDYAASPGLVLRGDFEDFMHDLELRASYTLPMHDVTFFGGYRYSTLEASGSVDGLGYDADLVIDGFQLGVAVTF